MTTFASFDPAEVTDKARADRLERRAAALTRQLEARIATEEALRGELAACHQEVEQLRAGRERILSHPAIRAARKGRHLYLRLRARRG